MSILAINKTTGAAITLAIISPYLLIYYQFVESAPNVWWLMGGFFIGMLFIFLHKIEEGTEKRLTFFATLVRDKSGNDVRWSNGFCLVPALFPILHYLDIYVLWRLKHLYTSEQEPYRPDIRINHFADQSRANYNINTTVGPWHQMFSQIVANVFYWFFSFDRKSELRYQSVGTKIIGIMLIAGCISTSGFSFSSLAFWKPATVDVVVNVAIDTPPTFPMDKLFEVTRTDYQMTYVEYDRTYVQYQEHPNGQPPQVTAARMVCIIVPAGKVALISTTSALPPRYVFNMEDEVLYATSSEYATWREKQILSNQIHLAKRRSWKDLSTNWREVDTSYNLRVRALLPQADKRSTARGGAVCF
jgi:hypothetical protein